MLAHDLALWLLSCPNEEVQFEKVHRTWTHDELMEIASGDFREKEIANFDDSDGYYRAVYDVQFTHHGDGAEVRVRVGDPGAMAEQGYGDEPLEGAPDVREGAVFDIGDDYKVMMGWPPGAMFDLNEDD